MLYNRIKMNKTNSLFAILICLLVNSGIARTYYVSTNGDDTNSGSITSPFKTIQRGADSTMPGDTVYVFAGTYRERVAPPRGGTDGKYIVYRGEPGKNVIIKGSDIWSPTWKKQSGNTYYAVPDEAMFNDDCYVDDKNPFKVPVSSTPYGLDGKPEYDRGFGGDPNLILCIGQVFVDGKLYHQKGYLNQTTGTPETWYYNRASGAIYINFPDGNPGNHIVEIATRRRIFAPHKRGLQYIEVTGFIMEHCGNQYPTNFWKVENPEWQQAGALGTRSGWHWKIRKNVIRFAHGVGIDFGNEGNWSVDLERGDNGKAGGSRYHIIDSNYIIDNGSGGTAAYGPSRITFTNNVVERNNNLYFDGTKRWESAGVKMHTPSCSNISNNLIRNNYGGWGLWLDGGSGDSTRVHGNVLIGHEKGFDLEIGTAYVDRLILDNNVIIDNEIGIASRESGGMTSLNNLILDCSKFGLENTLDSNRTGNWASDHHHHFNNIFINNNKHAGVTTPDYYRSTDRQFNYNIYKGSSTDNKFEIKRGTSTPNFSAWKNAWNSFNSGVNYDNNSQMTQNISHSYDDETLQLSINVNFDIANTGIYQHDSLEVDFYGAAIPGNGTAVPGPFQNLKEGNNQFNLWNGLKPLKEYEMPDEKITVVVKANNTTDLDQTGSWVIGYVPTSTDTAVWDNTVIGGNTVSLGSNQSWKKLRIADPGGTVTISDDTLTLGSGGIDMSSATQLLYFNSAITLGASQDWNVAKGIYIQSGSGTSGAFAINKKGSGNLVVRSNSFSHSGGMTISAGTMYVGYNSTTGVLPGNVTNNGYLRFYRTNDYTYLNSISGSGKVLQQGTGTLTLTGTNTYTGATSVRSGGELTVNGSLSKESAVTVDSGSTISGTGTIGGSLTIDSGGIVEPGDSGAGKLTVGSGVTLSSTSVVNVDLGAVSDTLAITGDLTLDGILNINADSGFSAGTYTLMTYTGTLVDSTFELGSVPDGYSCSITADAGKVLLTVEGAVSIIEIDSVQNGLKNKLLFAPNPASLSDGEVFFSIPKDLTGEMTVTIYDNLGNVIDLQEFNSSGGYMYRWDLRNRNGQQVSAGTYVAVISVIAADGSKKVFKRLVGVVDR